MTHDESKFKMNSTFSRSISRDFKSQDFSKCEIPKSFTKEDEEIVKVSVSRREMFGALLPTAGRAIAGILRSTKTELSSVIEDIKDDSKKIKE